jgi:hypothetical protein
VVLIKDQRRFGRCRAPVANLDESSAPLPASVYLGRAVAVSHQVVIFDGLSLLMPTVRRDAFADEGCYLELEGTLLSATP